MSYILRTYLHLHESGVYEFCFTYNNASVLEAHIKNKTFSRTYAFFFVSSQFPYIIPVFYTMFFRVPSPSVFGGTTELLILVC